MRFGLSEEQTLLQDNVMRFLSEQAPLDTVRTYADGGSDQNIWSGLIELGIGALLVPEHAGGLGMTPLDAAIVAECLGYHTTPAPFLGSAAIAPTALSGSGTHTQLLEGLVDGSVRIGVDFGAATGARADAQLSIDENNTANGRSLFVFDDAATHYLIADAHHHLYLADAAHVNRTVLTTVDKTRRCVQVDYNNTPVEVVSKDPAVFLQALDTGRIMLAADTLGAAQNMLDQAVEYAKQREQFNRPIGSFQAVKHMCAEMAAELEPCRAMVWFAAHAAKDLPDEARVTACHTKAHLAEVGKFVAKTSTEVHGGMGFTDLLGLHYWF